MKKAKSKGKSMGYKSVSSGGATDGARKSKQGQVSALLPQNNIASARKKRMARMEKADVAT